MSEAHMFCPACETRIRFPSGLPDRDWIECPRCGEEIPLSRPSRSRRRSSRRDRDRDDYDARSRRERPSRRRPAPARSERPRELASESAGGSAGLWVGLIGGAVGVLGVILGVIFFVNADKDQAPAAKPDQVADAADQNPAIDTDRVPNAREQFVANFPPIVRMLPPSPAAIRRRQWDRGLMELFPPRPPRAIKIPSSTTRTR